MNNLQFDYKMHIQEINLGDVLGKINAYGGLIKNLADSGSLKEVQFEMSYAEVSLLTAWLKSAKISYEIREQT